MYRTYFRWLIPAFAILVTAIFIYLAEERHSIPQKQKFEILHEGEEMEQEGGRAREEWELKRLRDPKTGKIPAGIQAREMAWVKNIPFRENSLLNTPELANKYIAVGPSQNGGRTRAFAFDVRYNGSTNRIALTGGINGGIFRTTDGGTTWTFVHPIDEVRSLSALAQDPRPGFQDTWYAGTGEAIGASASIPAGFVAGNGIFKSTDNGLTWNKLSSTADDNPTNFTSFDIVNRIAVNPANGDVYAAIQRRIVRSQNGGSSWSEVLIGTTPVNSVAGFADVMINRAGTKLFAAVSGRNPDRNLAGVWSSDIGNAGTWTRIAGGIEGAPDSVASWRGYDNGVQSGEYNAGWGRITFALAASNQNLMYVLVENANKAEANVPEADLFRCDMSTGPFTWTNVSSSLAAKSVDKDETSGEVSTEDTYFQAQGGYNMTVAIHPTQPNIVFVGGVNLYRSTDGFATPANTVFVGGRGSNQTYDDPVGIVHVDYHYLAFDPSNANRLVASSDGGNVVTSNASSTKIEWSIFNSQYQTIQYYHVGIDPTIGSRVYFGGSQDNSTTLRDAGGILGSLLPDSNDHYTPILGGDGCQVGMTKKNGSGQQYLFCSAQEGQVYRMRLFSFSSPSVFTFIKPSTAGKGEFVTYYHLDEDNTDFLYYVSNDSLWRTGQSTTVVPTSGWTAMSGANSIIDGNIFALATTRGPYSSKSHLFIGTDNGKVYRLKDPQSAEASQVPVDITPGGMGAGTVVSDISVNPRNQDTMMVIVSNYNVNSIFWTGNATAATPTWQVIEGNIGLPSVRSCAIVATTKGVEYYAGTSAGLFSTTAINDLSTSWSREISAGPMNTAVINSLAYRWQDNVMVVGTHGNGMFAAYIGNAVTLPPTGINDPIRNDKNFIQRAFPTLASNQISFQIGNMFTIKKVRVQITNMAGQLVYDRDGAYQNSSVDLSLLAKGTYVLSVTSPDRKYQFIQKFFKN